MLFNSFEFLVFFTLVVSLYFAIPHRTRWLLLLVASYYFYMAWVPEYVVLIGLSTLVDFVVSRKMGTLATKAERRPYLWVSVGINLGVLFVFKYYNWFNANLTTVLGREVLPVSELLLPIGISFYTLQTMSYTLDVYRGRLQPERHLGVFSVYVSFFPQLVAGPIERAPNLLPQFLAECRFDHERVRNGLRLMAWGMFKKAVVADRIAIFTQSVYFDPEDQSGITLAVGTVLFGFQLYCDFSGYSDIAIGSAQVIGFKLMENFKRPYFSKSIEELWGKRWHISLTSWINDYVYQPLAYMARRGTSLRKHSNVLIVFLITGLWHGAAWKFVLWGAVNGVYVLGHVLTVRWRKRLVAACGLNARPRLHAALSMSFTFVLFVLGSVFFLAQDVGDAAHILTHMFDGWGPDGLRTFITQTSQSIGLLHFALGLLAVAILFTVEMIQESRRIRESLDARPVLRWGLTHALVVYILLFGVFERDEFIYFQF